MVSIRTVDTSLGLFKSCFQAVVETLLEMQGVKDHMDIKSASTNVWCPYEQWIQVTDTQSHFSSNKDSAIANFVEAHNM